MKNLFFVRYYFVLLIALSVLSPSVISSMDSDDFNKYTYHEIRSMSSSDRNSYAEKLNQQLILNPDNLELNLIRAKIYLAEKKIKAAEGLLQRLNKVFSNSGEVNYFLSRLYSQTDSLRLSYTHMFRINTETNYGELFIKELENDALPFLTRFEKNIYDTTSNKVELLIRQWLKKDPSPASIENEYFRQMIGRIEYSFDNFHDGFAVDDRGKIYLKYGDPDTRREFVHNGFRTECWIYKNLNGKEISFDFIRSFKRPAWRQIIFKGDIPGDSFIPNKLDITSDDSEPSRTFFEDRAQLSNKYQQIFVELQGLVMEAGYDEGPKSTPIEEEDFFIITFFNEDRAQKAELPEITTKTPVPEVTLSVDYCRFKRDSSVVLEAYLGIPMQQISQAVNGALYKRLVFNEKLSIKDKSHFPIATHSDKIEFTFENTQTSHFIDMLSFTLPPEDFVIAFEVDDEGKRFLGSKVIEVSTRNFLKEDLFLSDLLFSVGVKENAAPGKYTKNGMFFQPYPYSMYSKSSPFFLYFEIYNLVQNHGFTNYDISYGLAKSYEKSILEQIFTLDLSSQKGSIQFNQNYNGNQKDDFIYFQINLKDLDVGEYILRVKVTDKNSGKSFIREKKFFLTL